jgi:hypothetical protein
MAIKLSTQLSRSYSSLAARGYSAPLRTTRNAPALQGDLADLIKAREREGRAKAEQLSPFSGVVLGRTNEDWNRAIKIADELISIASTMKDYHDLYSAESCSDLHPDGMASQYQRVADAAKNVVGAVADAQRNGRDPNNDFGVMRAMGQLSQDIAVLHDIQRAWDANNCNTIYNVAPTAQPNQQPNFNPQPSWNPNDTFTPSTSPVTAPVVVVPAPAPAPGGGFWFFLDRIFK